MSGSGSPQHLHHEQLTNHDSDSITRARHTEIARRYAWQARQRRQDKPDPARLLTLIRMRELERIFARRYGRLLPDDDAGRDDLILAAHHIAFLGGDVIEHIVDWARAWAPWMPSAEAEQLAQRVAAKPRKWTADRLAWRLRLSMAERTALRITTIGAFDVSKAERELERKQRRKEAERARRAKRSTGRARGRPKNKCVASREASFGGHAFSADASGSAREPPDKGPDGAASTKTPLNSSPEARKPRDSAEDQTPVPTSAGSRAAPLQKEGPDVEAVETAPPPGAAPDKGRDGAASTKNLNTREAWLRTRLGTQTHSTASMPSWLLDLVEGQTPLPTSTGPRAAPPPGLVAEAVAIARSYAGRGNCEWGLGEQEARRLLDLFWPRHIEQVLRCPDDHSRTLIDWQSGFRDTLDREYAARQMFRERRRKWEQDREWAKQQQQHELAITAAGGRLPRPQKIGPPRSTLAPGYYRYVTDQSLAERQKRAPPKLTPPHSKLAPGCRYLTVEHLAELEAQEAQAQEALKCRQRIYARRRERALQGADVGGVAP